MIKLSLRAEGNGSVADSIGADTSLREDAYHLAREIFKDEKAVNNFARQVIEVCKAARGKDLLIVHNPGGWGHARLDDCLEWEKGIVLGIEAAVREIGNSCLLKQYLRSGDGFWEEMRDLKEQFRFFQSKAAVMAAWLRFVITHVNDIKIVLIGISQGAAFGNAVMQQLGENCPVYSIELGFPFMYKSRRIGTGRTLSIEGGGEKPDTMVQGNAWSGAGIMVAAFFRWIRYNLEGQPKPLALCVNAPGHEYEWGNPEIQRPIRDFLQANFA